MLSTLMHETSNEIFIFKQKHSIIVMQFVTMYIWILFEKHVDSMYYSTDNNERKTLLNTWGT